MVIIGQRSPKSTCGVNNDNILEIAMFSIQSEMSVPVGMVAYGFSLILLSHPSSWKSNFI